MASNTVTAEQQREVERRIGEARRETNLRLLNLGGLGLTSVPEDVLSLPDLMYLDLSNNKLRSIPDRLRHLNQLLRVDVRGNPLKVLPDVPNLTIDGETYLRFRGQPKPENLELWLHQKMLGSFEGSWAKILTAAGDIRRLEIAGNTLDIRATLRRPGPPLQELLDSLADLVFLESLGIQKVLLESVPPGIRALRGLKSLALTEVGLQELPNWIGELSLERLDMSNNRLVALPDTLRHLRHILSLSLSNNPLGKLPAVVFDLASLMGLFAAECQIREIPSDILRLHELLFIHVAGNPLESPPAEVAKKGLDGIRDYWRQRADAGVDYLCEAKLIILGEPGAGKSSLARKIENPSYKLREDEKSTEGIDVISYTFPTVLRKSEDGNEKALNRQFQVSIWDFGGQEIYHATHQFFLTRRSAYVLVCDDRKEDTDFYYWLHVVEMLSEASPVLIVKNEKQDRTRDINLSGLRAQFENLRGALATNLDTNRGLDEVVQAIRRELEALPHVGVGLPATWKRVREALEKDPRDYISLDEYLAICQVHGFTRREDKLQLSGYLHDLGICLHFQDDPTLKNTVILKPSWGTDAVYRVLDDAEVIAARGQFGRAQLGRIWSEEKYAGMQDELLCLMMKFQLCYAIESGQRYIAPQLLSFEKPSYSWDAAAGLVVRYEYAFLPKGIVTRLIVAMHRLIAGGKLVWKTGVVLERDGTRAEIVEEYSQRRIRVRVSGPDPRGLLAIVDEELERLHAAFPRLKYERILPCPCPECRGKAEPYGFALEKLAKMARKNQEIQCHASGEMIDAARLIRDILPGAVAHDGYGIEAPLSRSTAASLPPAPVPEVFVSYAWNDESCAIVDKLQQALANEGIRLIRDREEVRYKDSIRDFMRRIGKGKCVVAVISEKYLKSENCMFELLEVAKAESLRERIFPILLADANIYRAKGRARYVKYWQDELHELDAALKGVSGENLIKLQADLNLYAEIRRLFDGIADTLRDMNALSPDQHESSGFDEVIRRIRAQLGC